MTEIKHKAKRLVATLLGLMMALVLLAPSAFADASTTITIKKPTDITAEWKDMTVTAYQVLTASADGNTYTAHADFKNFFNINSFKTLFGDQNHDGNNDYEKVYLTYDETNRCLTATTGSADSDNEIIITNTDALDVNYPESDLVSRIQSSGTAVPNGDISVLYTWLEKYIEKSKDSFTQTPVTKTVTDEETTQLSVDVQTKGYYALIFSNVPSSISAIQGILVGTAADGKEIDLKAEQIPLNKQVINEQHGELFNEEPASTDNKETSADVGDILKYQILTKIPTLADTENLTVFKLEDTLENQQLTDSMTLTLTKGNETVVFTAQLPQSSKEEDATYFTDGSVNIAKLTITDYAAFTEGEPEKEVHKQSFTVDFLPMVTQGDSAVSSLDPKITAPLTNYQGYNVKLTYSAMLTADAEQVNDNDVTLDYTNNDSKSQQKDHTEVYTYGIDVQKTFSDGGSKEKFEKVTFTLHQNTADNTVGNKIELVGADGVYHAKAAGETAVQVDLTLNTTTGKLTITGLDAGTYWLVETDTADGYSVSDNIQIVLTANTTDKKNLDQASTTAKINGTGNNLATVANDTGSISLAQFEVLNQKGFNLPQTGGAGTWMFTIGGILLVAAAGVLFALSRKKDRSK